MTVNYHEKSITIYLIARAGTGKYTIAKELEKSGYKIVDNHLINNPIFSLLDRVGAIPETAWNAIESIRNTVLNFISEDIISNYVLTNELYEDKYDRSIFNRVQAAAKMRNSIFIPVMLHISYDENTKRITNPERLKRYKIMQIHPQNTLKQIIKITHQNLIEIDVTELQADIVALKILASINRSLKDNHSLL